MGRLGRFVVRRRRAVILAWVALLLVTATIGSSAFSVLSTDFGAGTTTESGRVAQQLDDLAETGGQIAIIADGIDVDDPAVQARPHRRAGADRRARRRARRRRPVVDRRRRPAGHRRARRARRRHPRRRPRRGRRARARQRGRGPRPRARRPRGPRRRQRARQRDLRHRVRERPPAGRGDRPADRDRRHGLLLGGLVAAGMPLLVALGGVAHDARRARRRHDARRRVDLLGQRRQHARHRPGHRLRAADGQPVPRGARPRPRRPRRRRRHRRLGRHDRRVLGPHRRRRHVRAVRVRRAAAHLVRHRRAVGRAAVAWPPPSRCCRRRWPPSAGASSPSAPVARHRGPLLPAHPLGAGPRRRWSAAPPRWCWCCSACRSSSARFENGDARTLPRSSEVRATAPDPRRAVPRPRHRSRHRHRRRRRRRPRVRGLARRRLRRRRRRRRVDPPGHPAGLTVVDLVPTGTSQGAEATAIVEQLRAEPPALRHAGRRPGRRADRRQGQAQRPAARSPPPWSCWPPWSCCS